MYDNTSHILRPSFSVSSVPMSPHVTLLFAPLAFLQYHTSTARPYIAQHHNSTTVPQKQSPSAVQSLPTIRTTAPQPCVHVLQVLGAKHPEPIPVRQQPRTTIPHSQNGNES